ncbi:signal peptidase II [Stakelama saccharophila]|uniref:Lipoprotein signal peptidase n=1 Tax=Stakelama saccharophila TaxID=3075605 RepID=A0ABZ0BAF0_9SPHN|nr:signal peptidase II [Stakelama sp. W311]WNO54243.1 signal peptidase II [Stakelama sp. W311]
MKRARILGLVVALLVFLVDQGVKAYVTGPLQLDALGEHLSVLPIFDLRFVPNIGVSLGLLPADSEATRWALVALTALIALGVLWWLSRETNRQDIGALGLVLGGALGNILDRVRLGYVVDYADLHFGDWRPFLVFNVADAAITIGVLILLARALLVRDKPKSDRATVENVNA